MVCYDNKLQICCNLFTEQHLPFGLKLFWLCNNYITIQGKYKERESVMNKNYKTVTCCFRYVLLWTMDIIIVRHVYLQSSCECHVNAISLLGINQANGGGD